MATTLAQKKALADDATFQGQIKMQILAEAIAQLNATKPASSNSKGEKMIQLARSIVQSSDSYVTSFASAIAANSQLTTPVSDANVASAVTAAFPIIAGITIYE